MIDLNFNFIHWKFQIIPSENSQLSVESTTIVDLAVPKVRSSLRLPISVPAV